jgi:hypothetical protein
MRITLSTLFLFCFLSIYSQSRIFKIISNLKSNISFEPQKSHTVKTFSSFVDEEGENITIGDQTLYLQSSETVAIKKGEILTTTESYGVKSVESKTIDDQFRVLGSEILDEPDSKKTVVIDTNGRITKVTGGVSELNPQGVLVGVEYDEDVILPKEISLDGRMKLTKVSENGTTKYIASIEIQKMIDYAKKSLGPKATKKQIDETLSLMGIKQTNDYSIIKKLSENLYEETDYVEDPTTKKLKAKAPCVFDKDLKLISYTNIDDVIKYEYNSSSKPASIQINDVKKVFQYDDKGNPLVEYDENGIKTVNEYKDGFIIKSIKYEDEKITEVSIYKYL